MHERFRTSFELLHKNSVTQMIRQQWIGISRSVINELGNEGCFFVVPGVFLPSDEPFSSGSCKSRARETAFENSRERTCPSYHGRVGYSRSPSLKRDPAFLPSSFFRPAFVRNTRARLYIHAYIHTAWDRILMAGQSRPFAYRRRQRPRVPQS